MYIFYIQTLFILLFLKFIKYWIKVHKDKYASTVDENGNQVNFEEDFSNPKVWFLDHNFLESMFWMFKKVNCKFVIKIQLQHICQISKY